VTLWTVLQGDIALCIQVQSKYAGLPLLVDPGDRVLSAYLDDAMFDQHFSLQQDDAPA